MSWSGLLLTACTQNLPQELAQSPDHAVGLAIVGDELEDCINSAISKYGEENVVIITRSNKRANLFNQSFRNRIKLYEEDLCAGDKIMIVKNNYFWLPENNGEAGFIANGDMVEITRLVNRESFYGFNFCECQVRFIDYPNLPEQQVKIITDTLFTDNPALSQAEQKQLFEAVIADVSNEPSKGIRMAYLKNSPYYIEILRVVYEDSISSSLEKLRI